LKRPQRNYKTYSEKQDSSRENSSMVMKLYCVCYLDLEMYWRLYLQFVKDYLCFYTEQSDICRIKVQKHTYSSMGEGHIPCVCKHRARIPQSRQSAKLFLQSSDGIDWDSPNPSPARECARAQSLAREGLGAEVGIDTCK